MGDGVAGVGVGESVHEKHVLCGGEGGIALAMAEGLRACVRAS